jgi:glycosyltransferase involved in cell wall biosynthesis
LKLLFLAGSHKGPSSRFRVWQFVEPLRRLGHQVTVRVPFPEHSWRTPLRLRGVRYVHTALGSYLRRVSALCCLWDAEPYDVIFMNRTVVPDSNVTFLEPWLAKRNPRLIFDFDDALQHVGHNEAKLRRILPCFACVTPGNEYLASFAREIHPRVEVWPTVVDSDRFRPLRGRRPGPVRIGWSGSRQTLELHFPLLRSALHELAKTEDFELLVVADAPPAAAWEALPMRFATWTPETEVQHLQDMDIGLMPLPDKPFERGKCGCKAIAYMACGIPALVSPVGASAQIVVHGETGFHCRSDTDWVRYLCLLIKDPKLRQQMGQAARTHVEKRYSVRCLLPRIVEVFEQVSELRRATAPATSSA